MAYSIRIDCKTITRHEYLRRSDHYEINIVNKGRTTKTCEHCNKNIRVGTPHEVHKFYPEYSTYPTHINCSAAFIDSLLIDGEEPFDYDE